MIELKIDRLNHEKYSELVAMLSKQRFASEFTDVRAHESQKYFHGGAPDTITITGIDRVGSKSALPSYEGIHLQYSPHLIGYNGQGSDSVPDEVRKFDARCFMELARFLTRL